MKKMLSTLVYCMISLLLVSCFGEPSSSGPADGYDGVLRVGMECGYAPFNWTDPSKNEHNVKIESGAISAGYCDGYDVIMAKYIAQELNYELKIHKMDFEGLITALKENQIDVIIAGMSPTPPRLEQINFSESYYTSEQVVIVKKGSPQENYTKLSQFAGSTLVAQVGTLQNDLIQEATSIGIIHGTAYNSYPEAIAALNDNPDVDGVVAEYPVALSATLSNENLTIVRFEQGEGFDEADVIVSIGVRKQDTDLLNKINAALAKLSKEQKDQWMQDAISRQPAQ